MKAAVSSRRITVDDYVPPTSTTGLSFSVAHFLNWAADNLPDVSISVTQITKSVRGFSRTPREDSEEVQMVRRSLSRARKLLEMKFGRTLTVRPGIGARATVDSADIVKTEFPRKVKGVQRATQGLLNVTELVKEAELPTSADFREYRTWFLNEKKSLIKVIGSKQFRDMLMLPEELEANRSLKAADHK